MVISVNPKPSTEEFETLLCDAVSALKAESRKRPKDYSNLLGSKLEKEVVNIMAHYAKGTPFDGSIELVSGQRFPDIVAKKFYGVEVKTTKSNHWKSVGSSVAEGTRVEDVERIFMLFGKMCDPIDFMCRPYEDCLSDVVVTHSPRYLIDMNLKNGETIFDKINIPYDTLRTLSDPINTVLDYYRQQLREGGGSTWWSQKGDDIGAKAIVRMWNQMYKQERDRILHKGLCLFPELVSDKQNKYNRFAVWLATREGVICTNVRDIFSAGGRGNIEFDGRIYHVPKILLKLSENIFDIKQSLNTLDYSEIEEYWCDYKEGDDRYVYWCEMIVENAKSVLNHFPLKEYLLST